MPTFADLAFTPNVKAMQSRYGTRASYARMQAMAEEEESEFGAHEAQFIHARDSFYQATVSETGWPYLQHRGGPVGFLQVIDSQPLAYADFAGNGQFISVGNLQANDRIALFLVDYAQRRRLKILGRVQFLEAEQAPELLARLQHPQYRARIQRICVIKLEAFDWNCPQHIVPRFSQTEVEGVLQEFRSTIAVLQRKLQLASQASKLPVLGSAQADSLELVIAGIRQIAPGLRRYELRRLDGKPLPASLGALHMPLQLENGTQSVLPITLHAVAQDKLSYEIDLHAENEALRKMQQQYQLGVILYCQADFSQATDRTE